MAVPLGHVRNAGLAWQWREGVRVRVGTQVTVTWQAFQGGGSGGAMRTASGYIEDDQPTERRSAAVRRPYRSRAAQAE